MATKESLVESIYVSIKFEVTSGNLMPGHRVDIADLCARFRVSKSPVRNILNRLVGEGLLEPHAHDGFYRPWLTEQKLRDLYQWSQEIILLSLNKFSDLPPELPQVAEASADFVQQTERFFATLVALTGNGEYTHAMDSANARLRAIRRQKPPYLFNPETELSDLTAAWTSRDVDVLRASIESYHQRRLQLVPQIVALSYR